MKRGDATAGKDVFRFGTFGTEGFWTDAARLPQGMKQAKVTLLDALKLGMSVDVERIDTGMRPKLAAELKTDMSAANAPLLNDPAVMQKLVKAKAVIGLVPTHGKVGISCALCHTITDGSLYAMPHGGSIGHREDGRTPHTLQVGKLLAVAANSRAFYPNLQLQMADGSTIGFAPKGLTKDSTEADVDAFLSNPQYYPVGTFNDTPDGIGNPVHIEPLFRQDLAAPYGSSGQDDILDDFSNTAYTVLFDPTTLVTPGGRKLLKVLAGKAGTQLADDYAEVLKATGVKGYPYADSSTTGKAGAEATPVGLRVDNQKLLDLNAYLASLQAPRGVVDDAGAVMRGRAIFTSSKASCTSCHNADQSKPVNAALVPMKTIWPGYAPKVIAQRPPLTPIQDSPGSFDDKMVIVDASSSKGGGIRGNALPLLLDLARKPVFLHDDSVHSLDALLDPARGSSSPHPFYVADKLQRADVVTFLRSLDTHPTAH
ncbi:MAG: hypothetical protein M3Y93_02455 [Pseudomonadota bacterium]|nr:hypothetical protein [Pseudomonadota bacterium]